MNNNILSSHSEPNKTDQWNAEEIERAISLLYYQPGAHATANDFLTRAQKSPTAWHWSWQLLEVSNNKPREVEYFAACTIHQKISRSWTEVCDGGLALTPPRSDDCDGTGTAERALLRQRLIQCLMSHIAASQDKNSRRIVITKLCAATAALAVQMIGLNEWPRTVEDIISALQPTSFGAVRIPPERIANSLVELLAMIPEELHSCITPSLEHKRIIRHELSSKATQVFTVLEQVLSRCHAAGDVPQISPASSGVQQLVPLVPASCVPLQQVALKCWINWTTQLEGLHLEIEGRNWHDHLLNLIFPMVLNEQLVSNVVEALVLIYAHPEMHKLPQTTRRLIIRLASMDQFLDCALNSDPRQEEIITGVFGLITQVGERHSEVVMECIMSQMPNDHEARDACLKLVTMILQCSSAAGHFPTDEDYSCLAFNFWYSLHDDIMTQIESSKSELVIPYQNTFLPLFSSLLDALLVKLQFPTWDSFNRDWSADEREAFRCYRQDIGDTINYCYPFMKPVMVRNLMSHFDLAIRRLVSGNQDADVVSRQTCWQPLEAVLYAFSLISDHLDPSWLQSDDAFHIPSANDEEKSIVSLFMRLPDLPLAADNCPRLLATVMELIGSYCDLMADLPALLPSCVQLLLRGLGSDSHLVTLSATMALKDLTRECQSSMRPFAEQLLIACKTLIQSETLLHPETLNNEHPAMTNKEKIRLMSSVGYLLSILPLESILSYLNELLPPFLNRLQSTLDSPVLINGNSSERDELRKEVLLYINMLCMLFGSLDTNSSKSETTSTSSTSTNPVSSQATSSSPQPVMIVMQQVFPLLRNIALKWNSDEVVVEVVCDTLKRTITTLLEEIRPFATDLMQFIVQLFSLSFHPSSVDIVKHLFTLFCRDESVRDILTDFMAQIINGALSQLIGSEETRAHLSVAASGTTHSLTSLRTRLQEHTGLIDSIYHLCFHAARNGIWLFERPQIDTPLLYLVAIQSLQLPEKGSVRAVSLFMAELIHKSAEQPTEIIPTVRRLGPIVEHSAELTIGQIICVICGSENAPRTSVDYMADILMALNQKYFTLLCDSLRRWAAVEGSPSLWSPWPAVKVLSLERRSHYVQLVVKERKNKRRLKDTLTELAHVSRGTASQSGIGPSGVGAMGAQLINLGY